MITSLHIQNFKCFQNQFIPLAPLTLFTGFNAAGKSSTIQSLLLGTQLCRQSNKNVVSLNGDYTRLGTAGDVLCHSATERKISLEYGANSEKLKLEFEVKTGKRSLPLTKPIKLSGESQQKIHRSLHDLIFISAVRDGTLDVFPEPDDESLAFANVGDIGQYAPWWFNQYSDDEISPRKFHKNNKANSLREQLNSWAGELFPGAEVNTVSIERAPLVRLELRTGIQQQWKRPANIGYGLTYAFPILIAGMLAKENQILVVDSPEAHLHPMAQSKMGYFLGKMAAAGTQIIIETHSDHILNGVRLAVAKSVIDNDKVALHFFSTNTVDGNYLPLLTSPQINAQGQLSEWPEGFFDQTDKDLAVLNGWE